MQRPDTRSGLSRRNLPPPLSPAVIQLSSPDPFLSFFKTIVIVTSVRDPDTSYRQRLVSRISSRRKAFIESAHGGS